jgi:hypothetical protein
MVSVPFAHPMGSAHGAGQFLNHATWAQRLKRVFGIEVERCEHCGGQNKIIPSIEDPQIIGRILEHLGRDGSDAHRHPLPPTRASPLGSSGAYR